MERFGTKGNNTMSMPEVGTMTKINVFYSTTSANQIFDLICEPVIYAI